MNDLAEAARRWAIRVHDPAFADWDGLTAWLEADPAHVTAYDDAVDADAWAEDLYRAAPARPVMPATEQWPAVAARPRSRRAFGGAMAAGVAVLAGIGGWYAFDRNPTHSYVTAPGERRTIALADGSRIMLNGATRLDADADHPREVTLLAGEALFEVRHDADRPFVVTNGATRLIDVGTVFNVVADGGALDVAVAEGAVIYSEKRDRIRLNAGDALSRAGAAAPPVLRKADRESVGAWRGGTLYYSDAELRRVGADLARNLGRPIAVDARLAARRFSGTLVIDGTADEVLARTGPVLDVGFTRRDDGWAMTPIDATRP